MLQCQAAMLQANLYSQVSRTIEGAVRFSNGVRESGQHSLRYFCFVMALSSNPVINIGDILNYVGERKRSLVEGERVLNGKHLLCCGLLSKSGERNVFALCLQSIAINEIFFKFVEGTSNNAKLKRNHQYYAQVQLGMFIFNCCKCDFIIYGGKHDEIFIIDVKRDDKFLFDMIQKLQWVYFRYLLTALCEARNSNGR